MQIPQDLQAGLPDTLRNIMLPAAIAGAGGGALSGYMSSKANPKGETPSQRRRRILRNALVGTVLGGATGAALPTGARMLAEPVFGAPQGVDVGNRAMGFGLAHAAPIATLAGGGLYLRKLRVEERKTALRKILEQVKGMQMGDETITNTSELQRALATGGREQILNQLAGQGTGRSVSRVMRGHELLGEAGSRGPTIQSLLNTRKPEDLWGTLKTVESLQGPEGMKEAIRAYIREQATVPGKFGISELMARAVGGSVAGRSTTPLAEAYMNFVRPGMRSALGVGRGGWLGRGALLGAGVLGANALQNAVTGN